MLLTKIVPIKMWHSNSNRYKQLGYNFEYGDIVNVDINDVPKNSHIYVLVKCDICGKEYQLRYDTYNSIVSCDNILYCSKCSRIKAKNTLIERYGYDNPGKVPMFIDKKNNTMIERYGVTVPSKNRDILNKMHQTCIRKYGVKSPLENDDIREKAKNTNQKNLQVDYPFQSKLIQDKIQSGGIHVSKQQTYLCDLYNAEINYNIGGYFVDGKIDDHIVFEYDGSGHDISIVINGITREQFDQKERYRESVIISYGFNILRIKSQKDNLLNDSNMLEILEFAKKKFDDGFNIVIFDIDKNQYTYE